jgi:hypothetical protein
MPAQRDGSYLLCHCCSQLAANSTAVSTHIVGAAHTLSDWHCAAMHTTAAAAAAAPADAAAAAGAAAAAATAAVHSVG